MRRFSPAKRNFEDLNGFPVELANRPQARIIPRAEHSISRTAISPNALRVLYRLREAGYEAFLVGGCVRDLLIGITPKDFDIATSALPEEVKRTFRNCRLIGRRFRLAHVHFGQDVVEVATFRASANADAERDDGEVVLDQSGRILRDNIYGKIGEDVWRRDFTANALYYNIADYSVWDYVGGVGDVESGTLRVIGDPVQRYQEDPVRMLRAVRFAAKLAFRLHPDSEQPLFDIGHLVETVPPARLLDEVEKLLLGGYALETFELLRHYDLFKYLFPLSDAMLDEQGADTFRTLVTHGLANSDARVDEGKPITLVFLLAVLLWGPIRRQAHDLVEQGESPVDALRIATQEIADAQQARVALPRRLTQAIGEVLSLQPRFDEPSGRRALRLLDHPRFRAAYDFMLLRAEAGEIPAELAQSWTRLQELDPAQREAELAGSPRRRRRRRGGTRHARHDDAASA
jgi:poly(A) polymerase